MFSLELDSVYHHCYHGMAQIRRGLAMSKSARTILKSHIESNHVDQPPTLDLAG